MDRRFGALLALGVLVVVTQIGCTWYLVREVRRDYAANAIETFKACTGRWNPWEPYPWAGNKSPRSP